MTDRTEPPAPALTIDEVADRHRVSRRTVERWIASGRLPASKLPGGLVRIDQVDADNLLALVRPTAPAEEKAS